MFTLARADSSHFKTNFKEIYLDELIADCLRKVRVLADKRGVSLTLDAPAEMPMRGDERLLRRLLMNLLDNAIKYNHEGGRVSVRGETKIDSYRITISDTDAGIPEEQDASLAKQAKITLEKARAIAQKRASGKIEGEELEKEHGKLLYSFDIRNAKGTITEVQVDAKTGKMLSAKEESKRDERKEKREDEKQEKKKGKKT